MSPLVARRVIVTAAVVVVTALTTDADEWKPLSLVLVLGAAMVAADVATVAVRRVRMSAGLTVQTTIMALLGPGPAVASSLIADVLDARINRVNAAALWTNLAVFSLLGLVGGVLFDVLRDRTGLERDDALYGVLVMPMYLVLTTINFCIIAATHTGLQRGSRTRVFRESGLPFVSFELASGLLASVAVLVWAYAGLAAVGALLLLLAISVPLARMLAESLGRSDALAALRQVSDERAAEVARLASDRDRLLSEVVQAEQRERTRLAESLHDGPMQRLIAIRQDAAEGRVQARDLDHAIAETRALISAFHPATVRELGFEAALRAAIAPFPAARSVDMTIRSDVDGRELAQTLLLPIAQELVVNAVKHADPTRIDVVVERDGGQLVLEVNDDGVGIDTEHAGRAAQAGHVGLAMVRRRVEDAGGELEIATRRDGGTRSLVTLPETRMAPG